MPKPLNGAASDFTSTPVTEPEAQPALGYRSCFGFIIEYVNVQLVIEYDVDFRYNTRQHRNPIRGAGITLMRGIAECDDAAANLRAITDLLSHAEEYIESASDHPTMAPAHIVRGALEEAVRRGGLFENMW